MGEMVTLEDQHQLPEAFSPTAGFLANYIDSVSLQKRWRVTRVSLKRYEDLGLVTKPKKAFGRLWYRVKDICAIEANLFGPLEPEAVDAR